MSRSHRTALVVLTTSLAVLPGGTPPAEAQVPMPVPVVISEFRLRGPNGANDEFIEIYNNLGQPHTVAAVSGTGYGIAASDGITRCTIPNGTVIPAFGHYLCVNSSAYSLSSYPAGNGITAGGDASYNDPLDIPDNAGIAIFNNDSGGASYSLANRFDAVGSTSEANALYKEGAGYPALTPSSTNYALYRDTCGKGGSMTIPGTCMTWTPRDTDDNAADFILVDTSHMSTAAARLGAPGPENLSSPVLSVSSIGTELLDTCAASGSPPNRARDLTSDPVNSSTFGTLEIRRRYTNWSGHSVTQLRFRVMDLTTFPAPQGYADLRLRSSSSILVMVDRPPCGSRTSNAFVYGTTLEQPPSQPYGGGYNSSLSAGIITLATPLPSGTSVDLRFLLGVQQPGLFKINLLIEALP